MRQDENYFIFDGRKCSEFGVYCSGGGTYVSPSRSIETIDIPGRNGDIHIDKGKYENVTVSYSCWIHRDADKGKLDGFRAWLHSKKGYKRLEDPYHPEEFRFAAYDSNLDPDMGVLNRTAKFDVEFNCKPQRFLKSGEIVSAVTSGTEIRNPTFYDALPIIRVYGNGTLTVGTETISIASNGNEYIDIDSDAMDCFCGTVNCNPYVTMTEYEYPSLKAREKTKVSFTDGITKVLVKPRFWTI